ncbi:hypothetical protein HYALB_00001807 [Hymenoscyphus albidus]|uniref:Uncharacterized protein n=1 Tax=Hymenoscyphus albidus TaxID=595503 RepID=A0A9N9Q7Y9_9HELO|nr:hypothetical protein HYALB_00001807 [Hymenoscyphus albidus]
MMQLLDLDIEVLNLIIVYLRPTEQILRNNNLNLAYTCKSLLKLAQPYAAEAFDDSVPSTRYELLRRTLNENAEYGKNVKTFSFTVQDPSREHEISDFVQHFPNLRELKCESALKSLRLAATILSPNLPFRSGLQRLTLYESRISTKQLFELAALPKLKSLDIEDDGPKTSIFEPEDVTLVGNSVLQSLLIGSLHIDVFLKLLSFTSSLTELVCPMPTPGPLKPIQSNIPRRRAEPIRIPYVLSPRNFMSPFRCLSRILTTLHLNSGGIWGNFDGTRMDFSQFVALKKLGISSLCFFSPLPLGLSRDGFYKLLPPSLEELDLFFQYDIGIFYSLCRPGDGFGVEKTGRARFVAGELRELEYRWILELAQYKRERLRFLDSVLILEGTRQVTSLYKSEIWTPPASVEHVFAEADVFLEVRVRVDR